MILLCNEDIGEFLSLSTEEGWISDAWELDFLRRTFPNGCLVCRNKGVPVAFITSIKYGKSGWIGNLLVRGEWRGQGLGSALLQRALEALYRAGTRTVWLTASELGRPLYERHGFRTIDTIQRWRGRGHLTDTVGGGGFARILALDEVGWGDRREALLRFTTKRGKLSLQSGGFLIRQKCGDGIQLGPWGCRNHETAIQILKQCLVPSDNGSPVFLDVPSGNRHAKKLLREAGFTMQSKTTLMYRGEKPDYEPDTIYALASMGSMG